MWNFCSEKKSEILLENILLVEFNGWEDNKIRVLSVLILSCEPPFSLFLHYIPATWTHTESQSYHKRSQCEKEQKSSLSSYQFRLVSACVIPIVRHFKYHFSQCAVWTLFTVSFFPSGNQILLLPPPPPVMALTETKTYAPSETQSNPITSAFMMFTKVWGTERCN